jgi:hypothetical protein
MANVSPQVAQRIADALGNVTAEYVLSDNFTDSQANDAINMIAAGEADRLGAIVQGEVVNWDLINVQLEAADIERSPTGLFGGLRQKASLVFWVVVGIGGAFAYSLVKK